MYGGSMIITVLLNNHAPRQIDTDVWPILLQTPTTGARVLTVRQHTDATKALVYGQNGITEIRYSGMLVSNTLHPELLGDAIATAIFHVGADLWMDHDVLWGLVQQLAPIQIV
jgi:hypothetical protein